MLINVLTLFPEFVAAPLSASIPGRAQERGHLRLKMHQIRDAATDRYQSVDHAPFGGGPGMVMRADVLERSWQAAQAAAEVAREATHTIFLSPSGKPLTQEILERLAQSKRPDGREFANLCLVCGRFEGVDQRFIDEYVDEEISLGDFVLSGGEIAAAALIDGIARLLPGVVGNAESLGRESFATGNRGLLEHPQYAFPREHAGRGVPEVLVSGDHRKIEKWREEASLEKTLRVRPELAELAIPPRAPVYAALVHHDMRDKQGRLVTTSITNLDIHDISRSARTYGLKGYFLVNPESRQQQVAERIMGHWVEGGGRAYNPDRSEAFQNTQVVPWLKDAVAAVSQAEGGQAPLVVMTSARVVEGTRPWGFARLRQEIWSSSRPVLLVFGTGWGMDDNLLKTAEAVLVPIRPQWDSQYRHLSVRAAAVTVFDRLLGERNARTEASS